MVRFRKSATHFVGFQDLRSDVWEKEAMLKRDIGDGILEKSNNSSK